MSELHSLDKSNMRELIEHFPLMLRALEPESSLMLRARKLRKSKIHGVCIVGMGGSSISGEVCRGLLAEWNDRPLIVHRDYSLPKFVNSNWIVVAISYSGNTEETLAAFSEAKRKNCPTFVISSGGKITEESPKDVLQRLPKGFPPRAAFPLILAALLPLLEMLAGSEVTPLAHIAATLEEMSSNWNSMQQSPRGIAEKLLDKVPLFVGWHHLAPVAYRAKCQINENAKMASFHSELPEANHNEVEAIGVYGAVHIQPVFLRSYDEDGNTQARFKATSALVNETGVPPIEIKLEAKGRILEALAMIHFLDMVSLELALLRGVNPNEVANISKLKEAL